LVKRDSRVEVEDLLLVLAGSPVSPEEVSEVSLVVVVVVVVVVEEEAHSREERSRSLHLVPGVRSVEADLARRIRRKSLSEYPSDARLVITKF
jgi:hypothetical protein